MNTPNYNKHISNEAQIIGYYGIQNVLKLVLQYLKRKPNGKAGKI
jgi:hypothetical protein